MNRHTRCGCEDGRKCSKMTVCGAQAMLEDANEQLSDALALIRRIAEGRDGNLYQTYQIFAQEFIRDR